MRNRYVIGAAIVAVLILIVWLTGVFTSGDPLLGMFPERKLGPKARKALEAVRSQEDLQQAEDILDRGFAKQVSCLTAIQKRVVPVASDSDSEPRIRFYTYTWQDGTVECYTAPGAHQKLYHRVTGAELVPMTDAQAAAIIANAQKYGSRPGAFVSPPTWDTPAAPTTQASQTRPATTATPLPELGERPCCNDR